MTEAQKRYCCSEKGKFALRRARRNWLNTENGKEYRYRNRKSYYARTVHLTEGKRRWTKEEERILMHYEGTDEQLAYEIGRSVSAIQARRSIIKHREGNND